ncbi:MAG: PilW family protein, partial [bacterium]
MRHDRRNERRGSFCEAGFTLVELMVGIAVAGLVMIAAYGALFGSHRAIQRVTVRVDARQASRAAVQLLERDIRMAGSGWGRMAVQTSNNGAVLAIDPVDPGPGSANGCDSVSIIGGWDVSTALSAAMANVTATLKVASIAGFAAGDLVVITNGASAHLFQVTSTDAATTTLLHAASSVLNVSGGHAGWPVGGYKIGALAYRATWITYQVDSTSYRKPSLVRREYGKPSRIVAYNVPMFTIRYRLQDGSLTRNPVDLSMIDKIVPVVRTMASLPGRAAQPDSS